MKASNRKISKLCKELGELASPYNKTEAGQHAVFVALACALVAQGDLIFCKEHLPDAISEQVNNALRGCHE